MKKVRAITLRLDANILELVRQYAEKEHRTLTNFVENELMLAVERKERMAVLTNALTNG